MQRVRLNVKRHIFPLAALILIIAADQLTKLALAKSRIDKVLIKGLLSFTYTENTGAAFSFLGGKEWAQIFFICLTAVALVAFAFFYFKTKPQNFILRYSLVLIIAGAAGNFIDRLASGYVVDFIFVHFFPAVFNVADISLTIGAILFVFHYLFLDKDAVFKRKNNAEK